MAARGASTGCSRVCFFLGVQTCSGCCCHRVLCASSTPARALCTQLPFEGWTNAAIEAAVVGGGARPSLAEDAAFFQALGGDDRHVPAAVQDVIEAGWSRDPSGRPHAHEMEDALRYAHTRKANRITKKGKQKDNKRRRKKKNSKEATRKLVRTCRPERG